jgi:5-methyltetrahydropteroyltriglutamate--homocysteine methyltransferase
MNGKPPFHADHVGSLLRPRALQEARSQFARGELAAAQLREIEDTEIGRIIRKQEELGLRAVTDGEFRRRTWQWDFLETLEGVTPGEGPGALSDRQRGARPRSIAKVTGKLGFGDHPMLQHFAFVREQTNVLPKMCIPSPTHLTSVMRDWRDVVDTSVYPDLQTLFVDLSAAYRTGIRRYAEAGCQYLQIDDCNLSFLCDPAVRDGVKARGDDPDEMLRSFIALIDDSLRDRPLGMTITMHTCRGNTGQGFAGGGYEPVADRVFGNLNVDGFFLEFDDARSGGFEPLRFVPRTKAVAVGIVSTKRSELETKDELRRRLDAAAKYVEHERLCLCPQCGFASSSEDTAPLSEDEQWAKLHGLVEVAKMVWGTL